MNIIKIHGFVAVTVLCVATLGVGAVAHAADLGGFDDGWYEPYDYYTTPSYSYETPAYDNYTTPSYDYYETPAYDNYTTPSYDYYETPAYDYYETPSYEYFDTPSYEYFDTLAYEYYDTPSYDYYETPAYEDYFVETGYEDYVYEDYTEYFVEDTYYEPYVPSRPSGGGGSFSFNINTSDNDNKNTNVNENTNTNTNIINIANEQPTVSHQLKVPTCSISVNPTSVASGGSATVVWGSSNATNAQLTGAGSVGLSGTRTFSNITSTQTYTLTVSGTGGSNTCSTVVTVEKKQAPALACTISAHPNSISQNGASVLTWNSTGATSAWISDGIGSVATNGSLTVRPERTRNYTLTVSDGHGRTRTCSTDVGVYGTHVSLTQVPYTGLDFGPVGNVLYWFGLIAWAVGAGYVFVRYRGQVAEMALAYAGLTRANASEMPEEESVQEQPAADVPSTPDEGAMTQTEMSGGDVMMLEDDGDEGTMPSITIRRR